jgi:hypothetical protein
MPTRTNRKSSRTRFWRETAERNCCVHALVWLVVPVSQQNWQPGGSGGYGGRRVDPSPLLPLATTMITQNEQFFLHQFNFRAPTDFYLPTPTSAIQRREFWDTQFQHSMLVLYQLQKSSVSHCHKARYLG